GVRAFKRFALERGSEVDVNLRNPVTNEPVQVRKKRCLQMAVLHGHARAEQLRVLGHDLAIIGNGSPRPTTGLKRQASSWTDVDAEIKAVVMLRLIPVIA